MHGVGAKYQEICACGLNGSRRFTQNFAGGLPVARALQLFNVVEINAEKNYACRMQAAQALFDHHIDMPVVRDGGLPAHAADQPDGFHGVTRISARRRSGSETPSAGSGSVIQRAVSTMDVGIPSCRIVLASSCA